MKKSGFISIFVRFKGMKKNILFLALVLFFSVNTNAKQQIIPSAKGKNDTIAIALIKDGDYYIPWIPIKEVIISDKRIFKTEQDKKNYLRLKYNIIKVLPYANMAKERYQKLERDLAVIKDENTQKQLIKECEQEIKKIFFAELKKLSINQGGILIKLINRETNLTTYDLVKNLKGGLTAFFFQSIAKTFGNDLKAEYSQENDRDIESILTSIGYNNAKR